VTPGPARCGAAGGPAAVTVPQCGSTAASAPAALPLAAALWHWQYGRGPLALLWWPPLLTRGVPLRLKQRHPEVCTRRLRRSTCAVCTACCVWLKSMAI